MGQDLWTCGLGLDYWLRLASVTSVVSAAVGVVIPTPGFLEIKS